MGEPIWVPYDDFTYWVSVEQLEEQADLMTRAVLNEEHKRRFGEEIGHWYHIRTDETLAWMLRRAVQPAAYGRRFVEHGEEDLNGRIAGVDYPPDETGRFHQMADLGPCGPASLVGKVALELARRLEEEILGDQRAEAMTPPPTEVPP